jgi:hypothetical protein
MESSASFMPIGMWRYDRRHDRREMAPMQRHSDSMGRRREVQEWKVKHLPPTLARQVGNFFLLPEVPHSQFADYEPERGPYEWW